MKVKMLVTCAGSNCGKFVSSYTQGEVYNLSDSLANSFIQSGFAIIEGEKAKEPPANKANTDADYKNKAEKAKPSKKDAE